MSNEWLTVVEAAKISGYHPEYIRRLIRDGELKARKFSIVWQVSKQSLLDYVENASSQQDKRFTPKTKKQV
jgi:excisionase family DNA binding protein